MFSNIHMTFMKKSQSMDHMGILYVYMYIYLCVRHNFNVWKYNSLVNVGKKNISISVKQSSVIVVIFITAMRVK